MKKILHFVFSLINPDMKVTWLSMQYHRWESDRQAKRNKIYKEDAKANGYVFFEVPGAGDICISESPHHSTGKVIGFGIGISWARYGYVGGVLGRDEAKRMAEFILQKCSECAETMQEEVEKRHQEFLKSQNWTQQEYDTWISQYSYNK